MKSAFAEAERERLVAALLPDVAFDGWTRRALRRAAQRLDMAEGEAVALFPRGAPDMIAAFSHWADREMLQRLAAADLAELSLSRRVALALRLRCEIMLPWREAMRRGLSVLALPHNAPLALRLLYESVDAMWRGVDDRASDFSFYTKRASLAGIYAAVTLYWLDDNSPGCADTEEFIGRRLAGLHRLTGLRQRLAAAGDSLPNPLRLLRASR